MWLYLELFTSCSDLRRKTAHVILQDLEHDLKFACCLVAPTGTSESCDCTKLFR